MRLTARPEVIDPSLPDHLSAPSGRVLKNLIPELFSHAKSGTWSASASANQ